ncbi:unnamed protein product [Caenorhabditis brenneri]
MTIRIPIFSIFSFLFLLKSSTQFSEDTVKFTVSEDAPINTIIGRLDPILGYSYRLSRGNSKIRFDDQTLEFSISSPSDRESENAIDMLVITSPPSIIHVLIDILDVNDNAPKFPMDVQKVEIPETAPIGFRVQISGATDPDQAQNGTIGKYELVETLQNIGDTQTPFRVVESDGFVFLEVTGKLDREERELYAMRMTATDEGSPELSSSCLLNIIILDINDNPPDFQIRSLTIHWNGLPNTQLFRLNATDSDSGENGHLTYRILPGPHHDYFGITDENILVTQNNTKCLPRCDVTVEARDSGSPSLAATLDIVVLVEYGNEHEPNINIRFYPSDYPFIVVQPEDVNGKTLAILSITDSDGPLGQNSTIWIENGNENSIFSLISRQSINILTLKNVENAEKEEYNLEFVANDGQGPVEKLGRKNLKIFFKKFIKPVTVHVEKEYHVSVEKDTVAGSFVAHIVTNCSELCTFELMNSDVFRIDRNNGIIITSSPLPNDVSSYHLPIRIHPPPPSTDILETDVFVKVVQESIPKNLIRSSEDTVVHLKRAYTFSTWQNVSVGTVVGKLPRGKVYSTVDTESELGVFPDGSIFVGKSINKDFVTLPVTLENRNTTQTSLVTVLLKPLNLRSPTCHVSDFHVSEDTPRGRTIGRLHASDQDSVVDGVVFFKILTHQEYFHVDSATGQLILLKELDAEKTRNLTIQYEVRDYGTPPKSTSCSATVFIDDVNDNPPKFGSRYYSSKISGAANETVAIIHAEDDDVEEKNRKIHYRLLDFQEFFHVEKGSGKVTTIKTVPKSFGRINVTLEAVNVDSDNFLATRTFLLVTVLPSEHVELLLNSEDTIRIYKNDEIGTKLYKIDLDASDTVLWKTEDPRFHVDTRGNIILAQKVSPTSSRTLQIILMTESGVEIQKLKFHVEHVDAERNEHMEKIVEIKLEENSTEIMDLSENWKNWKIGRTILENSGGSNNFWIQNKMLHRLENMTDEAFIVLESEEDGSTTYKILHITKSSAQLNSNCSSSVHLITPPSTVSFPDDCSHVILQNQPSKLQIHGDTLLIPTQSELIQHVDLVSSNSPFMMTLIKDEPSEDVKFATSNILMLLSSVHPIGSSFGRVTAESAYRIRYFLVGTDKISIDPDTGELFLKKRFYKNLNDIQIVAVIPKGIAKAKITIEVIEDRLSLTQSNFFLIAPPTLSTENPIGSISIDRDDVLIEVIDEHFYTRNREIYAKKHFSPTETYYDLIGTVKKGKLSAPINITVFFGSSMDQRGVKENELMYEVEENSPIGTVVGQVPNYPTSKYRLVDPSCGLLIDPEGVLRTTKVFDHETTSLLKTKMIEPLENRIWDLLIFIGDVNDNKPKILNAPGQIIIGDDFKFKLEWEDPDDMAQDVFFEVVDGDVFGNLEILDFGVIQLKSKPVESFNATIRLYDNRPPSKVNFDDVTIEFQVPKVMEDVECQNEEFYLSGSVGKMQMKADSKEVTWRILPSENGSHRFSINPMTGEIRVISGLSSGDVFNLTIQAISYDADRSGYCSCRVHVLENILKTAGKKAPEIHFVNSTFEFWVPETTDRHSEVGKLYAQPESNLVFRILDDFNFTISPFDGTIFTNIPLDYEDLQKFEFHVSATNADSSSTTTRVIIHIIDENDEIPRFITGDVVNLNVQEEQNTVPYPMVIGSSIAEDLDEGQNGVVTYSILSGNTSLFAVNSTTGDILSLAPLDREESPIYELLIEAKDAGIPSLSATSRVVIHVEDINDNTPEFELPGYFVKIPENLKIGSKILKIHAQDKDEGSRLLYFLDSGSTVAAPFKIDVATGWITVAGKIDREETSEWRITVEVTDGERNSSVVVEIEVEDVNDNTPKILNQNLDVYIPEGGATVIHVVDAQDQDFQDHLKFFINDTTFQISELGEILSTPESRYPCSVRITVTDEVGHVANTEYRFYQHPKKGFPVFVEKMATVSVREHDEQELAVFKAKGQGVRYSIIGRCKDHLEMEGVSGILKTRATLDREQFSECHVFVIATSFIDNKPLSAITKILIKFVDINDNSPRFDHQLYQFNVTENSGATLIGHVTARDKDSNSRIFYEIVSGDPDHEFMITENGQIESIRDLDRETRSEYRLTLEAFDDGKPRRRGNTTVVIKVLDEDDNAPRFSRIFHVEIREDVKIGEEVILLSASDADEKSQHRFEFESSGESIPFRIEERTGMVFVNDTLDFEKKSSYRIKVRLTDGAWLIETSLFVNVKDVNDNSPIFDSPEYFFISNMTYSTIGKVHATDLDSGENRKIRYSLSSPYFRIHPDTGEIQRIRPLPEDLMSLEVVAIDHGIPRLETTVMVHVAQFESVETRKIRRGAKEGDVVGRHMESGARVYPRGMAIVTKNGDVVLKKSVVDKDNGFWILGNSSMIKYEVVESTEKSSAQDSKIVLNLTSTEPMGTQVYQIQVPGCVEFEQPQDPGSQEFRIHENGSIIISAFPITSTEIHVTCHDGFYPIQKNSTAITVQINVQDSPKTLVKPKKSSKIQKTIPKNLEIHVPSESLPGTILWSNNVPIYMENNGKVNFTRQNLILKEKWPSEKSQIDVFDENFRRTTITITPEPESPACSIFPEAFYFVEKSSSGHPDIQNFGWTPEEMKACQMELEDENPLFYANDSTVISLKPLQPGTYQFSLILRSLLDKSIRSKCQMTVTVPSPMVPAHPELPMVLYTTRNSTFELPMGYKLQKDASDFVISEAGLVRSRWELSPGKVYQLGLKSGKSLDTEVIRILLDDVAPEESSVIDYHVVSQSIVPLNIQMPSSKCIPSSGDGYQILENCRVITDSQNRTITPSNGTSQLHVVSESTADRNLEFHAVSFQVFSSKSSLTHLIQDLRSTYSDMKIQPLATWQYSEDVKYQMTLAIVDRNGAIVEAEEVKKTLSSFFQKHRPGYIEFVGFGENPCEGVTCIQHDSRCRSVLEEGNTSRVVSKSHGTIFDLPMKKLTARCLCGPESKDCEARSVEIQNLTASKHQKSCSDLDCGSQGSCVMDPDPICRCTDGKSGFESQYTCEKSMDAFSTTGNLEITLKNSKVIPGCQNCTDLQKLELDFRTVQEKSELLRVDFGKQAATVEILSVAILFSISDEYHRPIQTKIEKRVNDGRWHRLLLQMSDDGKKISIQIDGRGKEVKSRVSLPMLFTSKTIQVIGDSGCFRRILVQNQLLHPSFPRNKYFNIISTATVSNTCHMDPPSRSTGFLANFSNTTTVILLLILAIISLIALAVCILAIRRRWSHQKSDNSSSSGWKKATEIDAFAVPHRHGGHVNRSMVKSPDDDTYDVAVGGYSTQMKSTSTDDMTHIYTSSSSRRYQPQIPSYRRDGHINMAYL